MRNRDFSGNDGDVLALCTDAESENFTGSLAPPKSGGARYSNCSGRGAGGS
jgi:hypothetical protein